MKQTRRTTRLLPALALALACAGAAPPARANGNFTHVWVATDALGSLEAGALKELLTRDELTEILRNGAMYPDGGYAVGDGYGEISHWEPFHATYLEWIRANYTPPWSDEAARHIAFLMGMATHGMSDQLYDGMYLTRHAYYDENGSGAYALGGVDGATDSCFAATQGAMVLPEPWVPAEILAPLYEVSSGHQVDASTITTGHSLVRAAIMVANDAATHPETVAKLMALYPWACGHQDDPTVPGSPPTHGPAVARYWQVLWARLHGGDDFAPPPLGTYATGMTFYDVPRDAATPDSWVSFAMPRGLDPGTVSADTVSVTAADGAKHPVNLHVYYGSSSHLVNVKPTEDWAPDTAYTVTVSPPMATWDGLALGAAFSFDFSTAAAPAVVEPDVADIIAGETVEEIAASEEEIAASEEELAASEEEIAASVEAEPGPAAPPRDAGACARQPGAGGSPAALTFLILALLALRRRGLRGMLSSLSPRVRVMVRRLTAQEASDAGRDPCRRRCRLLVHEVPDVAGPYRRRDGGRQAEAGPVQHLSW
jgi:hypothetical protein